MSADQARVSVRVAVPPAEAFRVFTEEIDRWWRRGPKYRPSGGRRGVLLLEPRVGGRLFESIEAEGGESVVETGRVTLWEPPARLAFDWRATNFGPGEWTQVEVTFEAASDGTLVTVTHSGWSRIRPDHPVRHGLPPGPFLRTMGLWWGELAGSLREVARDRRRGP